MTVIKEQTRFGRVGCCGIGSYIKKYHLSIVVIIAIKIILSEVPAILSLLCLQNRYRLIAQLSNGLSFLMHTLFVKYALMNDEIIAWRDIISHRCMLLFDS